MKKRIIAVLLALVFVLCLMPATAFAETITGSGYTFDTETGELTVTTNAGTTAWQSNSAISAADVKSLTIGDEVDTIDIRAFYACFGLKTVTIPGNVKVISTGAFYNCTGITSLTIGKGVESIGYEAFMGCTGINNVSISDSVETIGDSAFNGCIGIKSVSIPGSVKTIGAGAFIECTGITSLTIGDGVENINFRAFDGCTGIKNVSIPNSVKAIGAHAFQACSDVITLTIGNGVKTIADYAFNGCTSLIGILSKSMTAPTIGTDVFANISADAILFIPGGATGYDAEGWPKNVVKLWTVSGTVFDENGSPVADATVTLASDDGGKTTETDADGSYSIPMAARNGDISVMAEKGNLFGFADFTVSDADVTGLNITLKKLAAPSISGPTAMTLTEGYAATTSEKFTITGNPDPSVSVAGNDSITWNDSTQCLDIAAGLPAGTYKVTLTAYNGVVDGEHPYEPTAVKADANNVPAGVTYDFMLTVNAPDPVIVEYTLTFETNGGSGIDPVIMEENSVIDLSSYKTTRSGYTFSGWYSDEALKNKVTSVTLTADTTVYAGWNKTENPDIPETGDFFSGILLPMTALALLLGVAIAMLKVRMLSLKSRAR